MPIMSPVSHFEPGLKITDFVELHGLPGFDPPIRERSGVERNGSVVSLCACHYFVNLSVYFEIAKMTTETVMMKSVRET